MIFGKERFAPFAVSGSASSVELAALLPSLRVEAESARYYACGPEWKVEPRTRPTSYWSWIVSGRGTVTMQCVSGGIAAEPGSLILFPAEVKHSFYPGPGEAMEMINVHFFAKFYDILDMPGLINLSGKFLDKPGVCGQRSWELCRVFEHRPPGWKQYMTGLIRLQLFELIYNFPGKIEFTSEKVPRLSRLRPALEFIEQKLSDPELNTVEVAGTIHVSQVYLRKLFKEAFGQSPVQFIHRRRIQHACLLLRQSGLRIKEIAAESGFNDLQFFYRIFRRQLGTTPAAYRQSPEF